MYREFLARTYAGVSGISFAFDMDIGFSDLCLIVKALRSALDSVVSRLRWVAFGAGSCSEHDGVAFISSSAS